MKERERRERWKRGWEEIKGIKKLKKCTVELCV
jgi:hypothetical protein